MYDHVGKIMAKTDKNKWHLEKYLVCWLNIFTLATKLSYFRLELRAYMLAKTDRGRRMQSRSHTEVTVLTPRLPMGVSNLGPSQTLDLWGILLFMTLMEKKNSFKTFFYNRKSSQQNMKN